MDINVAAYNKFNEMLKKPIKLQQKLPNYLRKFISESGILELTDDDEKARLLLTYLYSNKRIHGAHVITLFQACKQLFFENTSVKPNAQQFALGEKRQEFLPDNMDVLYAELLKVAYSNEKLEPLVTLFKTALRPAEMLSITFGTLFMLKNREAIVPLARKRSAYWRPKYEFQSLGAWVDHLAEKYKVDLYHQSLNTTPIYTVTYSALLSRLKQFYLNVLHRSPPNRFGLHITRYYWASTLLKEGAPRTYISELLGHSSERTLDIYIKPDYKKQQALLNDVGKLLSEYIVDKFDRSNAISIESFDMAE